MIFVSKFLMLPSSNKPIMQYIRSAQIDSKATTVIFLHGFPENSYTWAHFLPYFNHLGLNVFAPNLRGNLLSNNFKQRQEYELKNVVKDIISLLDKYQLKKAVFIGHDFGGAVAWQIAETYASRCEALALFNSPHPGAYSKLFHKKPWLTIRQSFRAWYMYLFQLGYIPEKIMSKANGFWLDCIFKWSIGNDKYGLNKRISFYKKSLKSMSDLKGAIAVYRANVFGSYGRRMLKAFIKNHDYKSIKAPVQLYWGMSDYVFENELLYHSISFCNKLSKAYQYKATGHWVHHEHTEDVINKITDFLLKQNLIKPFNNVDKFCMKNFYSSQLSSLYNTLLRGRDNT